MASGWRRQRLAIHGPAVRMTVRKADPGTFTARGGGASRNRRDNCRRSEMAAVDRAQAADRRPGASRRVQVMAPDNGPDWVVGQEIGTAEGREVTA